MGNVQQTLIISIFANSVAGMGIDGSYHIDGWDIRCEPRHVRANTSPCLPNGCSTCDEVLSTYYASIVCINTVAIMALLPLAVRS
jgi:hypothetical protein